MKLPTNYVMGHLVTCAGLVLLLVSCFFMFAWGLPIAIILVCVGDEVRYRARRMAAKRQGTCHQRIHDEDMW